MIRFGNCISYHETEKLHILAEIGYDYAELSLAPMRDATSTDIADFNRAAELCGVRCEVVNVLFPGDIKLTGHAADHAAAGEYLDAVLAKTQCLGFQTVVFGSGGARTVPEGFDKAEAMDQILSLIRSVLIPRAEQYDLVFCLEELNQKETNILNTLDECASIVNQVNHPRFKLVADLYHIIAEGTAVERVAEWGSGIKHCHIASSARNYPHAFDETADLLFYSRFFKALKAASYHGRMSIEAGTGTYPCDSAMTPLQVFKAESSASLAFLKTCLN